MKIQWIGQGGYKLTSPTGKILLIDPYLSDIAEQDGRFARLVPAPLDPATMQVDGILFTHDHNDHLDPGMMAKLSPKGVEFIGPSSCSAILRERYNIPSEQIITLNRGEEIDLFGIHLGATYAEHTEDSIGFLLTDKDNRYYFTGDSLLTPQVGHGVVADIIFTCINGRLGNMSVEEAALLTQRVGARVGVPNHYGMFADNTENPALYVDLLAKINTTAFVMEHGIDYASEDLLG